MLRRPTYALSLKQPWATLVVSGRKTIEIRKWATTVRGRVRIHAARIADPRPEGWLLIDDDLKSLAEMNGGIIGSAELIACRQYRTAAGFASDRPKHFNQPEWFVPPKMYGFEFRGACVTPFLACKGNVKFFRVSEQDAG
ncbi:MAG TPA: ASCH domain-containing protein [Gemmataceae bacterium]|nr:ASCH domain-containing protein [Gemmataceae bacterium]